jgi:hypothetical protein
LIRKRYVVCFQTLILNNFKIIVWLLEYKQIFIILFIFFLYFYIFYCYSVYAISKNPFQSFFHLFSSKLRNQIWSKIDSSNRNPNQKFFKYVVAYNHAQTRILSIYNNYSTTNFFFRSAFPHTTLFLCFTILRKRRLLDPVSKTFQTATVHQNVQFYLKKNWNTEALRLVQNTIVFHDFYRILSICIV